MKFSHLHNHTQFSLLDGASSISRLYEKAAKDEMPAMAITDHGNMFGVFQFVAEAWKKTKVVGTTPEGKDILEPVVKPVIGCEFYLVENRLKRQFSRDEKDTRYHQLFLAKNEVGYRNLVKLCSLGYMEGLYGKYPRIDKELVLQHHEGLIATTCCLGAQVPRTILRKGEEEGEKVFKWWLDLFGEDYYVEMQRHDIPEQLKVNEVLLKFARKYNVPIIASNDSHYVEQEDANAHDILLCINTGEKQSTPSMKEFSDDDEAKPKDTRFAFYNDQFYFKTTDEMSKLFSDIPEAIDNTGLIVDKIKPMKLEREILLPHFKVPPEFNDDQDAYLEHLTWEGAKRRYVDITPEIDERLRFELFTIKTMGFAGYFLIVSDFIKAGRDLGVFVGPGRGSAAGSVVAYCIGITNIDPIKYKLLFERFLNPERKSMPDIDTDFDDVGRQKVIDYVVDKYGKNQVAHIVTYGTMAAKMSIKDVARALDLPLPDSNALAKLVPERPGIELKRILHAPIKGEKSLESKEGLGSEEIENVNKIREIYASKTLHGDVLRSAEKLEGSVRNTGIHAAGIIIAPKDLTELIPVSAVKDVDLLITQFEGNVIENAGVIKMDFLGLKTLTIIKDALELIRRNYGLEIDIDTIPLDDLQTYELYQRGETNATFQFESPGMQKYLRELKPDKFDDLIAMNALYRPGPLEYIPNFIKRKQGEEEIVYDLPDMQEYLEETYGITVYQEQVMLLSQKLAGFSKGDADVLRKAMGKKQIAVLNKMKSQFIEGATKKGHPEDKLNKIWTDWEAFAQYAFNKSHSTCYAFVAYQTAYLKAHYPAEFMAAVLNNQGNIDKIKFYMEECQRMGLSVLGPDVNESLKGFSVSKESVIRFGMNAIKGVGEAAVEDIITEREANGPYTTVFDFISRVNQRTVNKKSLESLVLAGAMDSFKEMHRAQYFYAPPTDPVTGMERLVRFGNQVQASSSMASNSLFGEAVMPDIKPPAIPECDTWTLPELLDKEKDVIGIYLSAHPLDGYKFEIQNYNFTPISEIENNKGRTVRIAGFITDAAHMTTKKGSKFGKMVINDYTGNQEIVFWEKNYVEYAKYIDNGQKLMITGVYQEHRFRPGVMEFLVQSIVLLDEVRKLMTRKLHLLMPLGSLTDETVAFLTNNLRTHPGNTDVFIQIFDEEDGMQTKLKSAGLRLEINDELVNFLNDNGNIRYSLEIVNN
ncbi:MAG: DNA polymerase III subunit alpha [Bacteroidetes bacterium 43-93]|nr:DNA polymerase III subunit alpha [Bacteroidota bacterium]OJW98099.1 MAG: DNA polymerase III subunit alpha [Bacteroidetes bacterium 43-93]